MVKTSPDAPAHKQQSQILVPIDAKGVNILEGMEVFGHDDAPHGHTHIYFDNVRVPKENMLLGEAGVSRSAAASGTGSASPLHALHRRCRACPGTDDSSLDYPSRVWQAHYSAGQEPEWVFVHVSKSMLAA